uniref:Farnesyl diphosphate synthase n=1 Tax=Leptocylindrus danicus TaxID=163516 RepID=A0A7S2JT51_9STRA|mmetsp:Transcript_11266/g.17091  ORF Transcript_11266/g.17091 Transcript_11266/m.17091 type:complete len:366 (+) Transcript_11266:1-1098(+)
MTSITYPLEAIAAATTDKAKFETIFPLLRDEMIEHMKQNEMPEEACEWAKRMMDYNVPGGKLNRGVTVIAVQRTLVQANEGRELTDLEVARASVLGWAVEFLQAFFLVADDVMDDSQTRRGQPCWYKLAEVGNIAINDSFLLESFCFTMIKKHFGMEPYYGRLLELFLEVVQQTEFGQLLDLTSQPATASASSSKIDLSRFTLERYKLIVKYKTAFYTFYLSVAIGMITSGVTDPEAYSLAKEICCIIGEYFQIQDDYLDCYGDPAVIGKVGTDIQDNKCSWLVVQALERVDAEQKKLLEENYGQWDDDKVKKVKDLYGELGLEQVFKEYEEASYERIQKGLEKVELMPKEVFELLLKKIYKRSK